jgi:hypothetical protein
MDIIREALEIDPTSKSGLRWKVRPRSHFHKGRAWKNFNSRDAGNEAGSSYKRRKSDVRFTVGIGLCYYWAHRIVYALHYGIDPGESQIDHINGNGADNRIENLRLATNQQNSRNRRIRSDNTSGHKGVSWSRSSKKWGAKTMIDRKQKHLGYFDSIEDASAAYEAAAQREFGEFYPRQ